MDSLERILGIRAEIEPRGWSKIDFQRAKIEGYRRWREIRQVLVIDYQLFGDAVAVLVPGFRLPIEEERAATAVQVPRGGGNCPGYALLSFLKWERCPVTHGLPNPYEPWVEIWEHGGAISVEHAEFVDLTFSEAGESGQGQIGYA
jgi:hypothetical protein